LRRSAKYLQNIQQFNFFNYFFTLN